jgi:hypothetical protein
VVGIVDLLLLAPETGELTVLLVQNIEFFFQSRELGGVPGRDLLGLDGEVGVY